MDLCRTDLPWRTLILGTNRDLNERLISAVGQGIRRAEDGVG